MADTPQKPNQPTPLAQGKKKLGQKGKYSLKKVEQICRYVQMGMTNIAACHLCNIGESTLYEWLGKHPEFAERLKEAEEKAEAVNLDYIRKAREKSWVAAAWLLERRFPERYSLVKRHELSGPGGRPVPIAVASVDLTKVMTLEQLDKLAVVLDQMDTVIEPDGTAPDSKGV